MSTAELFSQLAGNISRHTYTVVPVPPHEGIYFGVNREKRPCLFIDAQIRSNDPSLRTAFISLNLNQSCHLTEADGTCQNGRFHTLICEKGDQSDIETFIVLVDAFLVQNHDHRMASQNIGPFFRSVARLFSITPGRDRDNERQGLWGELFVMSQVRGFKFWAPFWHNEVTRVFDFSAPGRRLEVKTSASGQRIHHFSHSQVFANEGEEIVVTSLMVTEDDTGLSLRELITSCREIFIHTPHYLKLEKAVRYAAMDDSSETGPIYNERNAIDALYWFKAVDIPHFWIPEPPGVSHTSYRIDLSSAPRIDPIELNVWINSWLVVTPDQ